MSDKPWLGFQEAVALVRELRRFSDGKSTATVKRAIDSGEVGHTFTEQYIVKQENQARQDLTQSIKQEVARNFKMSGSALDIMRSRGQQGAHERAARRLRQMVTDIGSPEFYEALMSGYIRISRKDLLDWLDRNAPTPKPPAPKGVHYAEEELIAEGARGVRDRTYENAFQAAQALAPRAVGIGTPDSTVTRLRKKIGAALRE